MEGIEKLNMSENLKFCSQADRDGQKKCNDHSDKNFEQFSVIESGGC